MSEQKPIRITELEMTCRACPSQWEGWTDDGKAVYIRYRWATLWVYVGGHSVDEALDDAPVFAWLNESEDEYHGELSTSELKERLPVWIEVVA